VGLASALAVVTLGLWATGRIGLYINPDAAWWAVSMSILLLVLGVASCAVPISRDEHDHADEDGRADGHDHASRREPVSTPESAAAPAPTPPDGRPSPPRPPRSEP
jgi:hypothetical protein